MSHFLFSEFNQVSEKQWKQKIQVDLKGADYNDSLLWKTNEGITVKPFYHSDNLEALEIPKNSNSFSICQTIFVSEEKIANFLAKDALNRGATSIQFEANTPFNIDVLLHDVTMHKVDKLLEIHFKLHFLSEEFLAEIIEKTKDKTLYLNIDSIGNFAKNGNWFTQKDNDFTILKNILKKEAKNTNILSVDASLYQNAGANTVQQVAYALAHANEYLNYISQQSIPKNFHQESLKTIQFHFAVGGNYFFEIAKLRAFRVLWKLLIDEYKLSIKEKVFATPSLRNKTLYDYNVNMLRTTTECMSAILGGADTIANISYDSIYHKKNEFGERIARNQLLILQEESYFKEASQVAEGTYYIEALTKEIAEKALAIFKDIEKSGGFLKQLFEGTIQRKIEESAQKEQTQFDKGEQVLLGTNRYANPNDSMKDEFELYPFVKIKPRKTLIKPIIAKRLAEKLEESRLEKE